MDERSSPSGHPIEVGELAPDFSLPSAQGKRVELREVLKEGPVFLWFATGMV